MNHYMMRKQQTRFHEHADKFVFAALILGALFVVVFL